MGSRVRVKNSSIEVRTFNGLRVLNARDIDKILGNKNNEASKRIHYVIHRRKTISMVNGKDYSFIPAELFEAYKDKEDSYNFPKGGYILTGSGYQKAFGENADDDILEGYYGITVKRKTKPAPSAEINGKDKDQSTKNDLVSSAAINTSVIDIAAMQTVIDNCNKVLELQTQFIQQEREANAELRGIIKDMVSAIALANDNKERILNLEAMVFEFCEVDYKEWKKNIIDCANKVLSKHNSKYSSTNSVLTAAYKLLNKEYGVVFEQEKKEFYALEGRSPVSTLELLYWSETHKPEYKNLLVGKLNTLYSER